MGVVIVVGDVAVAVVLGTLLAGGLLLLATRIPRWSAPTLAHRIAPYLRDIADPLGLTPLTGGFARAPRSGGSGLSRGERLLGRIGGAEVLQQQLARAGWITTPTRFRARQLAAAIVGLALGAGGLVAITLAGRFWGGAAVLPPTIALGAVVACRMVLTAAAKRRGRRIQEEVPTVLEFLALCLAAGENLLDALRRVSAVGAGELTAHVRTAVLASGTGSSLSAALGDMARSIDVPGVTRAVDHLIAAIDRGAPLAEVLQAQANDAREDARRVLIEQAGRREIFMLLPLVFLVLPLSVLFAIFPGIVLLRLGL